MKHQVRTEPTNHGLLIQLANHYTTSSVPPSFFYAPHFLLVVGPYIEFTPLYVNYTVTINKAGLFKAKAIPVERRTAMMLINPW